MSFPLNLSLSSLLVPVLVLSFGLSGAAYGEKGGNGNGNNGNGNGNGNSNSNGGNASSRQNAPHANTDAAAIAADSSMPHRLNAYKEAYINATVASAEAAKYQSQYQAIAAMSEADFAATYPGADYRATLDHLAQQVQTNQSLADAANAQAAGFLSDVTAGRVLDQQGLAELHQMLGL